MEIRTVGIIGMGALGVMYGKYLTDRLGKDQVFFIADEARAERYRSSSTVCNGQECDFSYLSPAEAKTADLIMFAVKFMGMEEAIKTVRPFVGENTVLISVLNGVLSEPMLEEAFGAERVLYACVQGMDAGKSGNIASYQNMGYIAIGNRNGQRDEKLDAAEAFFENTGLSYQIPENIVRQMWSKMMLNTGLNQVSAVFRVPYREMQREGEPRAMMLEAMREVRRVAETQGVELTEGDVDYWMDLLDTLNPDGRTSMCQDVLAGRKTEVDLFAGTMIRLAAESRIPVPVNEFLYKRIRELENYAG